MCQKLQPRTLPVFHITIMHVCVTHRTSHLGWNCGLTVNMIWRYTLSNLPLPVPPTFLFRFLYLSTPLPIPSHFCIPLSVPSHFQFHYHFPNTFLDFKSTTSTLPPPSTLPANSTTFNILPPLHSPSITPSQLNSIIAYSTNTAPTPPTVPSATPTIPPLHQPYPDSTNRYYPTPPTSPHSPKNTPTPPNVPDSSASHALS